MNAKLHGLSIACALLVCLQGSVVASAPKPPVPVAGQSLHQLMAALTQPSVDVRIKAVNALAALGPKAAPAVPAIINALNENLNFSTTGSIAGRISPRLTDAAIDALAKIGPAAREAGPYLVPLLTDRNELFRREQVLNTLYAIGLDNSASKVVMQMVQQEGRLTQTRVAAIRLLGKIDPPATEALALLQTLVADQTDQRSRKEALIALTSINKRSMANAPDKALSDKLQNDKAIFDQQLEASVPQATRAEALHQIIELGPKASYMVPRILLMLNDKDPQIKQLTVEALAAIGKEARSALPALINQLCIQKTNPDRQIYSGAIASIDPTGQYSIPLLQSALNDPFKARSAISLLEELGTMQSLNLAQQMKTRWRLR